MRIPWAAATDKATLAHDVLKDSAVVAQTIIPPNMPNYQSPSGSIPYEKDKAKMLLQLVYPDISQVPSITFSYPSSQVTQDEAEALQQMWQTAPGLSVKLLAVDPLAYNEETQKHLVQFGFTQWSEHFPDPYDWLMNNLTPSANNNLGQWHNSEFDQTLEQAKTSTGDTRVKLYSQAEQIAISDVGLLPLDHQVMAAIIPSWLRGVTLNPNGLALSDWSDVSLSQH